MTDEMEKTEETLEEKDIIASKEDINKLYDAVKELTKTVGNLVDENRRWFRAGKMGGV